MELYKISTIGKNIRKYRLAGHLTQEALAEKTGLSENYIGMWERGEKVPSLETFIIILNALHITSDMVLNEVVDASYSVKTSLLIERMDKISENDRKRIHEVIEVLLNNSTQIKP